MLALIVRAQSVSSLVTVQVLDHQGQTVTWAQVRLVERGTGTSHTAKYSKEKAAFGVHVPYGLYSLLVDAEGMESHAQRVRVRQPNVDFRVGLSVGRIGGAEPIVLSGVVNAPEHTNSEIWVTLIPLLDNDSRMEFKVDSSGRFMFTDIDLGKYLVVVTEVQPKNHRQPTVLVTKEIAVTGSTDLRLETTNAK